MKRKTVNLRDQQEVLALMKILYGNDEVKDDTKISDSHGKPRATRPCEVAESAPDTERVLLQE
jgi:hypothetical protein